MPISYPSFNYVKIHKFDNTGVNNDIALGQATRLRIKYDTEPGYLTIGNILTKTEYPTYWLYKVQSLGSDTADNYIIDYRISASFSSSTLFLALASLSTSAVAGIESVAVRSTSWSSFSSSAPSVALDSAKICAIFC